jgi:integrase
MRHWRALAGGADRDQAGRYLQNVTLARRKGMPYLPAKALAEGPISELVRRIEVFDSEEKVNDSELVSAVLGGEGVPTVMISDLPSLYEEAMRTSIAGKSDRQKKKWRMQRDTAISVFVDVIGGDRPLAKLTRENVLELRRYWQDRIVEKKAEVDTANKMVGRIGAMYRMVSEVKMLGLPAIFDKVAIRGAKGKQRVPYPPDFVQAMILAEGALADLNEEARRVVFLITETGLRLSEACNLSEKTIILDHKVPHVRVRPDGRQMKTDESERDIPLVGVALLAMKLQPKGFPRYVDKADTLSALVNKYLKLRNLRPNGETLYSLRHTFKDRLRAAKASDELKDELMGHAEDRPAYGFGYSLESKLEVLKAIAFRPPLSV